MYINLPRAERDVKYPEHYFAVVNQKGLTRSGFGTSSSSDPASWLGSSQASDLTRGPFGEFINQESVNHEDYTWRFRVNHGVGLILTSLNQNIFPQCLYFIMIHSLDSESSLLKEAP